MLVTVFITFLIVLVKQNCHRLQISKTLLGDDQKLKLPRFLEEEQKTPEATKQVAHSTISAGFRKLLCDMP